MTFRKLTYLMLATYGALIVFCFTAAAAHAGTYHYGGIGPHAPHATPAIHVGPVGYSVSGTAKSDADDADDAAWDSVAMAGTEQRLASDERRLKCDGYHVEYVMRHGISTPRPLRGYHGCQKYAMDSGYWAQRHHRASPVQLSKADPFTDTHTALTWSTHFALFGDYSN